MMEIESCSTSPLWSNSSSPFHPSTLQIPFASTSSHSSNSPSSDSLPSSSPTPFAFSSRRQSYKSTSSTRQAPARRREKSETLHDRFLDRCLTRSKLDRSRAVSEARGSEFVSGLYARDEDIGAVWTREEEIVMRRMSRRELECYKRDLSDDWVDAVGEEVVRDAEEEEDDGEFGLHEVIGEEFYSDTRVQSGRDMVLGDQEMETTPMVTPVPSFAQLVASSSCLLCNAPSSALVHNEAGVSCLACQWFLSLESLRTAQSMFYAHGLPPTHEPLFYNDTTMGTGVMCSSCDEMVALA